jgi:hypothetical protein
MDNCCQFQHGINVSISVSTQHSSTTIIHVRPQRLTLACKSLGILGIHSVDVTPNVNVSSMSHSIWQQGCWEANTQQKIPGHMSRIAYVGYVACVIHSQPSQLPYTIGGPSWVSSGRFCTTTQPRQPLVLTIPSVMPVHDFLGHVYHLLRI